MTEPAISGFTKINWFLFADALVAHRGGDELGVYRATRSMTEKNKEHWNDWLMDNKAADSND